MRRSRRSLTIVFDEPPDEDDAPVRGRGDERAALRGIGDLEHLITRVDDDRNVDFAQTVREVRSALPEARVEVLSNVHAVYGRRREYADRR